VRALTVGLRARVDMAVAEDPAREKYYELLMDREEIQGGDTRPAKVKRASINERLLAMERAQRAAPILRECLLSLSGLKIDGEPATPATLASSGPEDLCNELVDFIQYEMRLSDGEEKNSSSASDSNDPEPLETPSSSA